MAQHVKERTKSTSGTAPQQVKQVQSPHLQPDTPEGEGIDAYNLNELLKEHHSKSNVIRFLTAQGYNRTQVANFMGIRYQHVRNVLLMPVEKPRE